MADELETTMALLARTPGALDVLLRGLPEAWTLGREGEGTWNACDIVGHLLHCERADWLPRVRTILQWGEARTFEPLDRLGFQADGAVSLEERLDELARLRAANLDELRSLHLGARELARRGRHPALGEVTLGQLLAAWAAHDLTHLHQISRVLAHQVRAEVGPWSGFMGVLKCAGHGDP
jgi:hypothetical protein